ncbi:lytic transglycosylase domain-containing protein [Rhodospirillum centenum]|uniref:Membrane-bound lytic murein transglycosylase A n=1 Tax=Rhodospirillum centenum (strain ATCC 51521 / SW) TaxID=414684 RepID=B6INE4_RHOCS|nr:transglycosylase SLT domain-containing protein [Rhodospirillum centenum]ACI99041.1 Membrane-bound lytic murein transglycosylase A precursor [Rhodospirillum centenum SW]
MRRLRRYLSLAAITFVTASPAAAGGSPDAQYGLAKRYERADGVEKDTAAALDLYCAAARQGHADAAFAVGWMYLTGTEVAADRAVAAAWFRKAAAAGHASARRMADRMGDVRRAPAVCHGAELARAEHRAPAHLVRLIDRMAPRYGLDPALVFAVVAIESGFRTDAVSPRDAMGLMQLTRDTADRFGVGDPMDPAENLKGGMRYLRWLLGHFDGDVTLALAAYNAGEGAVLRHKGIPPYKETRAYVEKIRRYYREDRHPVAPLDGPAGGTPHRQRPAGILVVDSGAPAVTTDRQVAQKAD